MNLFLAFFGKDRYFVPDAQLRDLLNLFLQKSVSFSEYRIEEGGASFSLPSAKSRRLLRDADARGIPLRRISQSGIPAIFAAYRKRWGLLIGALLAILLLFFSGRFLWDVRITGNEIVPTGEIESLLRESGLYPGCRLSELRVGEIENRVLIATDRLSWVSINLTGTVARVQVLESVSPDRAEGVRPANLVAAADGQIELLELYYGRPVVKIGQAVRAGDLLVSGISDSAREGVRYTRAAGVVLARTERVLSVRVCFEAVLPEYGEARVEKIALRFFDISVKIFKRTGNREENCAIIEKEKGLEGIGLSRLPFGISVTLARPISEGRITRSADEVAALAFDALEAELSSLSSQIEILEKSILPVWNDEGLTLTCTLRCVENIARQVEFDVLP